MKKQSENIIQNILPTGGTNAASTVASMDQTTVHTDDDLLTNAGGTDPAVAGLMQLRAENEILRTTIRQTEAHRRITGELAKAGARSPELLFSSVRTDVQFAEDGSIANAAALVERLKSSFPEQFGAERPSPSIDAGAGVAIKTQLTKSTLAKMKPAEIAALDWADVRRVLSN